MVRVGSAHAYYYASSTATTTQYKRPAKDQRKMMVGRLPRDRNNLCALTRTWGTGNLVEAQKARRELNATRCVKSTYYYWEELAGSRLPWGGCTLLIFHRSSCIF